MRSPPRSSPSSTNRTERLRERAIGLSRCFLTPRFPPVAKRAGSSELLASAGPAALTMFWLAMIPVSLATGWVKSVTYVSALSLWALVSGHWSAWQAARVEVHRDLEAKARADEDIAGDVVEQVIEKTDIDRA